MRASGRGLQRVSRGHARRRRRNVGLGYGHPHGGGIPWIGFSRSRHQPRRHPALPAGRCNADRLGREKAVVFADDLVPGSAVAGFPLRAILIPRIVGRPGSRVGGVSRAQGDHRPLHRVLVAGLRPGAARVRARLPRGTRGRSRRGRARMRRLQEEHGGELDDLAEEIADDPGEREQEQEGGLGRFEGYFASMLLIERFAVVGFLSTMHGSLLRVRQVPGVTMQAYFLGWQAEFETGIQDSGCLL